MVAGGLGVLESVGGFDERYPVGDAGVILSLGVCETLFICLDGVVIEFLKSVLPPQFEEIDSEAGFLRQALILEIGGAYLGAVLGCAQLVSQSAP